MSARRVIRVSTILCALSGCTTFTTNERIAFMDLLAHSSVVPQELPPAEQRDAYQRFVKCVESEPDTHVRLNMAHIGMNWYFKNTQYEDDCRDMTFRHLVEWLREDMNESRRGRAQRELDAFMELLEEKRIVPHELPPAEQRDAYRRFMRYLKSLDTDSARSNLAKRAADTFFKGTRYEEPLRDMWFAAWRKDFERDLESARHRSVRK